MNPQILLFIIKLVLGGIAAFLAIFVMSKTRDASWMFLVAGFLFSYASIVIDLMAELGIISVDAVLVFGMPLISLLSAIIPSVMFITAFIIKLAKKR
ncbi:MAG: hypothetical protein K5907_00345 [Treponema sp.]|nr:hypothetical protein [Treponema sp.]